MKGCMKQQRFMILAVCIVIAGLMLSRATLVHAEEFRIGIFNVPPQSFLDKQGQAQGAAVDYFKIVAQRMGLSDLVFVEYPLSRLLSILENGGIDMILFIAKNPAREATFQFPTQSYFALQGALAVLASSPLQAINSVDDLDGFRIGIVQDGYVTPMLKDAAVTLEPVAGSSAIPLNLQKLLGGRIDAVYIPDMTTLRYEIARLGKAEAIKILFLPETPTPVYSIFSSKQHALLPQYEAAILEGDTQLYQELVEAYYTVRDKK